MVNPQHLSLQSAKMRIQVGRYGMSAFKRVKPVLMDFEEICQDHQRTLYLEAKRDRRNRLWQIKFVARIEAMDRRQRRRLRAQNAHNRRRRRRDSAISVSSTDTNDIDTAATNTAATNTAATNTAATNTAATNTAVIDTAPTTQPPPVAQQHTWNWAVPVLPPGYTVPWVIEMIPLMQRTIHEVYEEDSLSFLEYIEATPTAPYQFPSHVTETHVEDALSCGQYMEAGPTESYQFHSHFTKALEADLAWTCNGSQRSTEVEASSSWQRIH